MRMRKMGVQEVRRRVHPFQKTRLLSPPPGWGGDYRTPCSSDRMDCVEALACESAATPV